MHGDSEVEFNNLKRAKMRENKHIEDLQAILLWCKYNCCHMYMIFFMTRGSGRKEKKYKMVLREQMKTISWSDPILVLSLKRELLLLMENRTFTYFWNTNIRKKFFNIHLWLNIFHSKKAPVSNLFLPDEGHMESFQQLITLIFQFSYLFSAGMIWLQLTIHYWRDIKEWPKIN